MGKPIISCPHCGQLILIETVACTIFRHGVFRNSMRQLPPHSTKEVCDRVVSQGLIYGCGKPFRYDGVTVSVCKYI